MQERTFAASNALVITAIITSQAVKIVPSGPVITAGKVVILKTSHFTTDGYLVVVITSGEMGK